MPRFAGCVVTGNVVVLSRDPFARVDTVRRVERTNDPCPWCGQNTRGRLFRYGTWADGVGTSPLWDERAFCSVGCRPGFYG